MTGGGSLLRGLDVLLREETKLPINVVENPLTCVVLGTGKILENISHYEPVLMSPPRGRRTGCSPSSPGSSAGTANFPRFIICAALSFDAPGAPAGAQERGLVRSCPRAILGPFKRLTTAAVELGADAPRERRRSAASRSS